LCSVIGNSPLKQFEAVCTEIAGNVPLLIQLLEQQLPADKICALLNVCTAKVVVPALDFGIDKCDVCKEVVGLAEGALQQNKTETEIETLLNELCSAIANSPLAEFAPICEQIAGNVPLLVQLIESQLPPEKICTLLKVCTSAQEHVTPTVSESIAADLGIDGCDICKEVVTLAEAALQQNKTETEIETLVTELCGVIAKSPLSKFAEACNQIASNIPLLVQLLEQQLPAEKVCSLIQQCPASQTMAKTVVHHTAYSMDSCDVCKEAVALAEYELEQQKTEQEITTLLHELCTALGNTPLAPLAAQCNAVADAVPQLIPMIENKLTPATVCAVLKQCAA